MRQLYFYTDRSDKQLVYINKIPMTLTQWHNGEKYRLNVTAEALRIVDTGCVVEEHRDKMIKDRAQGLQWRPKGYKQLTCVQLGNADLKLDKTGFKGNKENLI